MNTKSSEFPAPVPETSQKDKQPMFSVPGLSVEEQYGTWMKAGKTFRNRTYKVDSDPKQATNQNGGEKPTGKEKKPAHGTHFEVLQEEEPPVPSFEKKEFRRNKEIVSEWRKKETRTCPSKESKETEDKRQKGKQSTSGKVEIDKPMKESKSDANIARKREKNMSAHVRKEGSNLKPNDPNIGPSPIGENTPIAKSWLVGKKRSVITRPKVLSPILKHKEAGCSHNIVVGSMATKGPLVFRQNDFTHTVEDFTKKRSTTVSSNQPTEGNLVLVEKDMDIPKIKEHHKSMEEQLMNSPKEIPDPSTTQNPLPQTKDLTDLNDLWYETHDDAAEESQGEDEMMV